MIRITFYYKPGCWFCDMAEDTLNGLEGKFDLEVKKVDITTDDELYNLYRFDIPVFEFKDGSTLHGRLKKKELFHKLQENEE